MRNLFDFSKENLPYDGVNLVMARIVRNVLIYAPIPNLGIGIIIFLIGNTFKALIITSTLPLALVILFILYKGHLRSSVILLTVVMNILLTYLCVIGLGIHDFSIVGFPLIILFACLVLRLKELWIVGAFTSACLILVVLGENLNWYQIHGNPSARMVDILIISLILIIGVITTSGISKSLKTATERALHESDVQKLMAEDIQLMLEKKHELFREVHHRVKNHLAFINSLIDMEAMNNPDMSKAKIKRLQSRVVAVARVHDQLYHSDKYETVKTKNYLEGMISQFMMSYQIADTPTTMKIDDFEMEVTKIIHLGISIHEIVNLVSTYSDTARKIEFILTEGTRKANLVVMYDHNSNQRITDSKEKIELLEFLAKKLNGSFEIVSGEQKALIEIEFNLQ